MRYYPVSTSTAARANPLPWRAVLPLVSLGSVGQGDSKSAEGNLVRVRLSPRALQCPNDLGSPNTPTPTVTTPHGQAFLCVTRIGSPGYESPEQP